MSTLLPCLSSSLAALPAPYRLRAPREEDDGDNAFLATLYRSTRDDLLLLPGDPALAGQLIAMQQRAQVQGYRHAYPQASYLLLECDGTPIGRLVVHIEDDALRLVDIAILPEAQHQGAASTALAWLQALATTKKWHIELGVGKQNLAARRLYQRLGFQVFSEDALQEQLRWSAPRIAPCVAP